MTSITETNWRPPEECSVVAPTAADLLAAWEWGLARSVAERGVMLLSVLLPGHPMASLVHVSVGERDLHLLHGRRLIFGPDLDCVVVCPTCATDLELRISVDDLLAHTSPLPTGGLERSGELQAGGWRVGYRLIDSQDLVEAASAPDAATARRTLLRRCTLAAVPPDGSETAGPDAALPPQVEAALVEELERHGRVGSLDLGMSCPECGLDWTAPFDILGYLWAEVEGWAYRTMREVHLLATAYGWRESDILGLTPWRRDAYLQMSGRG